MTWKIVCDSSCDLPPEMAQDPEIGFASVPLRIVVGEQEFVDEYGMDVNAMLEAMLAYKGASSSACPSPEAFKEACADGDNVILITITSGLSGAYNSALRARDLALEETPDKNIFVLDSLATSGVMVLLVRKAQQLIRQGLAFDEIVEKLTAYRDRSLILFSLSSFDNLVKSGRMSKVAGIFASTLGIRVVARNTSVGTIDVLEKVRGLGKAIERLTALMPELREIDRDTGVVITHCNNLEGAKTLEQAIRQAHGITDITILPTQGLCSFYAGQSGVLLSFL